MIMREDLIRKCFNAIKSPNFEDRIAHTGVVYDEESGNPKGKFILFHGLGEDGSYPFIAYWVENSLVITSPSFVFFKIVYSFNPKHRSWSNIHAIGELGEPDYISMPDILTDIISVLKRVLW